MTSPIKIFRNPNRWGGTYFEPDGTLVLSGNSTVWDDLRVPLSSVKTAGAHDPGFTVFMTDGAGSQGIFCWWFDAATEEELFFACQLPHSWAGTAITPHVHWTPKTNSDGDPVNQKVKWGLEYAWASIGSDFGAATAYVYGTNHHPADANVVAGRHYMTDLTAITPTADQNEISSMIICRIFRQAADGADTYEADAGLLEIDFHYEINTMGSRTISDK